MPEPRTFTAVDLRVGLRAEFERDITVEDVASFAALSGDHNPLHIDDTYARQTNYSERIVHGAFQVGLASAMAGMYLPGREVVVGSFQCRFPAPLHYPSRVRVLGEITSWAPQAISGTLRVRVTELSHSTLTAEIHVGFSLHEKRSQLAGAHEVQRAEPGRPLVLVTGAGGGIGERLVRQLAARYRVIGVARSLVPAPDVEWITADLTSGDWEEIIDRHLGGRKIYAVVHAAWPGAPQGSLMDLEGDIVAKQVEFGSLVTIRIARFLKARAEGSARLVVLGTTYATLKPVLNLSAYSLGKATLEHTVRLLAPEMARNGITVNSIAPSFVPVGLNSAATQRGILMETSKVPLGKLCSPEDIAATVEFFLSSGASFITGQLLALTGGQL